MLHLNKVIDGQIILLFLNGISNVKLYMLTSKKSSLARTRTLVQYCNCSMLTPIQLSVAR